MRLKRGTKQYITVALISIVVVGGAGILAYCITTGKIRETYEAKLTAANEQLESNERMVYVSTKDILAGGIINEENTEYKKVLSSQAQETYIDSSDLGKMALIDITAGLQITKAEITEASVKSDLRETNFSVIANSTNIANNDTVDVRLLYPNGENYIVLSKKIILDMAEGSIECFFWLSEEEIQLMSSAIVDAYLYEGSKIYTTEYIEPTIQEASAVTYTPSLATMKRIQENPNIVSIASQYLNSILRKELENRLAESSNQDITATNWDTSNEFQDIQQTIPDLPATDEDYYYDEDDKGDDLG